MRNVVVAILATAACNGASARLSFVNNSLTTSGQGVLADGTSLRLKIISVSLAPDVDPVTMNNIGTSANIWFDPECGDDNDNCNVDGFALPANGPRITRYFDLSRPTAEVDADLSSEDRPIDPGTYRYARLELCKALGGATEATVPTMMWAGPSMAEQPFTSGDCGRTSLPFDPPLVIAAGDSVTVDLGYDLAQAIVTGAPAPGGFGIVGSTQQFRACADVSPTQRTCMSFPDFAPSATKL